MNSKKIRIGLAGATVVAGLALAGYASATFVQQRIAGGSGVNPAAAADAEVVEIEDNIQGLQLVVLNDESTGQMVFRLEDFVPADDSMLLNKFEPTSARVRVEEGGAFLDYPMYSTGLGFEVMLPHATIMGPGERTVTVIADGTDKLTGKSTWTAGGLVTF